jgi:leucyl aminopeptidase
MEFKVGTAIKGEAGNSLVYFIFEDDMNLDNLDPDTKSYVEKVIEFAKIKGKLNETQLVFPMNKKFKAICLAGLGKINDYKPDHIIQAMASAAKVCRSYEIDNFSIMLKHLPENVQNEITQNIAEGAILGTYQFTRKTDKSALKKPIESITAIVDKKHVNNMQKSFEKGKIISESVCFSRDLTNTPAEDLTPEIFSEIAIETMKGLKNVKVEVLDKQKIEKEGMGGLLAVNRGSDHPPAFVIVKYNGSDKKDEKPLVYIGKGITYDTGGIDLKSWREMHEMKFDMAGAGTVLAAIKAIAQLEIKRNIVGLMPLTENMIDSKAQKAGDIITMYNGKTVEYINTDAEGRMILADAYSYSKKFDPAAIIELSTLTGSTKISLGGYCAALVGPDKKLNEKVIEIGEKVTELCWELPLMPQFDKMLDSKIADIANIPMSNDAMTSIGAVFLKFFAPEKVPWAHIDICSMANGVKNFPYIPEEGSGWGTRLLVQLAEDWE